MSLKDKLRYYYFTAIFSVAFALIGFSYNAWRMEVSEDNNNIRTAAFEVLLVLAEFEQIIYAAHYDQDEQNGSPRLGWVKVGLAHDMSMLIDPQVESQVARLKEIWTESWSSIHHDREATDKVVKAIGDTREKIKAVLHALD